MENRVGPYSKLDNGMLGWMEDCNDGEPVKADALIEIKKGLSPSELRFLRGHGVLIRERKDNQIIHTMSDVKADQVLCLAAKPYVFRVSLSQQMIPVERVTQF